jgi:hypothetical protein
VHAVSTLVKLAAVFGLCGALLIGLFVGELVCHYLRLLLSLV